MDTSNIERICCISRENCELKSTVSQQSSYIGQLLQEKRDIQEQYEALLQSVDLHHIIVNTSNIETYYSSNI